MNQVDGTLAGYTFGYLYLHGKGYEKQVSSREIRMIDWVCISIDVLCGHSLLKGPGPVLMNFVKCLTYYIYQLQPNKHGFILNSIEDDSTLDFYEKNDILPLFPSLPADDDPSVDFDPLLFRYWNIPPSKDMKNILRQFRKYDIKFKVNPEIDEGLYLEEPDVKYPVPLIDEISELVAHSELKKSPSGWVEYMPRVISETFFPSPEFKPRFSHTRRVHKSATPLSLSVSPTSIHSPSTTSIAATKRKPHKISTKHSLRYKSIKVKSRTHSPRGRTF